MSTTLVADPPPAIDAVPLRPLLVPWTATRAYVVFDHAEVGPDGRVELVFTVKHSTKFSTARIRALPMDQAVRLHAALGMLIP